MWNNMIAQLTGEAPILPPYRGVITKLGFSGRSDRDEADDE